MRALTPHDASIDTLLELGSFSTPLRVPIFLPNVADDLRRLALVMAVATVDA